MLNVKQATFIAWILRALTIAGLVCFVMQLSAADGLTFFVAVLAICLANEWLQHRSKQ